MDQIPSQTLQISSEGVCGKEGKLTVREPGGVNLETAYSEVQLKSTVEFVGTYGKH